MEKNKRHRVYFAIRATPELIRALKKNRDRAILIIPDNDTWNDFTIRTRFRFTIVNKDTVENFRLDSTSFLLSFLNKAESIKIRLKKSRFGWLPERRLPEFFSILPDLEAYRKIVKQETPKIATDTLLALHDVVAIRHSSTPNPKWFPEAIKSTAFQLSFMRSAETFFAFHNAGSVLLGLQSESLDSAPNDLKLRFKLPTFENEHELIFKFNTLRHLEQKINVIIGKNGVGKSQALFHIAQSLLKDNDNLRDGSGDRPQISRLLAISSVEETSGTFPRHHRANRIYYKRLQLSGRSKNNTQTDIGDALTQLARSTETIKGSSRWNRFINVVNKIVPDGELHIKRHTPIESHPEGEDSFAAFRMLFGGEQQQLERWGSIDGKAELSRCVNEEKVRLSSGQKTFINFAALVCLHVENGTLLLFDEPETHLHPDLITQFVQLLDEILSSTGSLAIIATHSPYFVREIPRSQVIILDETEKGIIHGSTPRLRTLGADVGEISHFVFGDSVIHRLHESILSKANHNNEKAYRILTEIKNEISTEAWMRLSREFSK